LAWVLIAFSCARDTPPPTTPGYPKPYKALGQWYQPLPHARGYEERGIASWYGEDFHGRKTSSGETYDMFGLTAAHKTLPLGTHVRVDNLANGKSIELRINDRGPFVRGRVIDLSFGAAKQIGLVGPGTAPVEVTALGVVASPATRSESGQPSNIPLDYYSGNFTFQVGAFRDRRNAERLNRELAQTYTNAHIVAFDSPRGMFFRVRVGRCTSLEEAIAYEQALMEKGFKDAFAVAE
jgi:rare lipoprotein A